MPNRVVNKLLPDYARPRVYALNQGTNTSMPGTLLALNSTNGAIVDEIPVNLKPTDMAIAPANDAIYVINVGSLTIAKVDLDTFTVVEDKNIVIAASPYYLHLAVGRSNLIYFTDGAWAPRITTFDYANGTNVVVYDDGNGAGGINVTHDGRFLYRWRQYGWGAGNVNSWVTRYDAFTGVNVIPLEDSFSSWRRDPVDTPIFFDDAEQWVFNKQQMFAATNVTVLLKQFPDNIYAVSRNGLVAFGTTAAFDTRSGITLTNLSVSTRILTLSGDQKKLFCYDSSANDMAIYDMTSIASVSGSIILSSNGLAIISGEATSVQKGTVLSEAMTGQTITRSFAVTNSGTVTLNIDGIATNGGGADCFVVAGVPPTLPVGGVSNFTVSFSTDANGIYTAVVSIVNNSTNSPYLLNLCGTGYTITTNNGPASGKNSLLITMGAVGNGSDVTNVTICGVKAAIQSQTATSVVVIVGAGGVGIGDIVVQSASQGASAIPNAYTYNPQGIIGTKPYKGPIIAGYNTSIALKENGTVVCWGDDGWGQNIVPSPNTNFIAVAVGYYHTLGLKADSTVVCWGRNNYGQLDVPSPNTEFIAVAGGRYHSIGLKADGSVVCWGDNSAGQRDVPSPNTDFVAVAGGRYHSIGLKADGTVVGWGANDFGQCNVPSPNTNFVAIACGASNSLALTANGTIVCWGDNSYGQGDVPSPNTNFTAIGSGKNHSLGLKADSTVVCWGRNNYGQNDVPSPNTNFVEITGGEGHSLGLKFDGTIVGWGGNDYGQCNVPSPNSGFAVIGVYDSGVTPSAGSVAGGTMAYITGLNLCNGSDVTNVTLCGIPVASIISQSATQIIVQSAAALAPTNGDVAVFSTSYGVTTASNAFSYTTSEGYRTVAASAGPHGRIEPSGVVSVASGGGTSFVVRADEYYHIRQILTNDIHVSIAYATNMTVVWSDITIDGTIHADFAADTATNNTPCWWLAQYGLATNNSGAMYEDGDGMPAWQEYIAGTDPTDSISVFRVLSADITEVPTNQFVIHWQSASNRFYSIYWRSNMLDENWAPLTSSLRATPTENVYTDLLSPSDKLRLYRLGVTNVVP